MYRPLRIVRSIVKRVGSDVNYTHDDLVFIDQSDYLLQFNDKSKQQLFIHFNKNCSSRDQHSMLINLRNEAKKEKFKIKRGTYFFVKQKQNSQEPEVHFL